MPVEPNDLAQLPLFAGLTSGELEDLAAVLEVATFEARHVVMQQNDHPNHPIYILLEGSVEVTKTGLDGRPHVISTLSAPSVFGEVEVLARQSAIAAVHSVTAVRLACLRRGLFDELCEAQRPGILKVARNLARVLACRLAATDERLAASFDVGDPAQVRQLERVREVLYSGWHSHDSSAKT